MINSVQKKALRNYRRLLANRRGARFDGVGEPPRKGGILAMLRRSPLVGAYLNLVRSRGTGRKVDL